jgi:predicted murein hydrolase (TIGR00659 family)
MSAPERFAEPLFGIAITVLAYGAAKALHRRLPWAHPLFFTCLAVWIVLKLTKVSIDSYQIGGSVVQFFLSPATIALGVPLYKQWGKVRRHAGAVITAIVAGAAGGMAAAGGLVRLLGGSRPVLLSMVPKSVTTPISMEVARQLGGVPELAAAFTITAGLIGSVIGPALLRRAGVRGDLAIGAAMGTSSHGIGTARVIADSELQGGVSGLAMALAGIVTSLLAIPVHWWLR